MRNFFKSTSSLILVIIFLFACITGLVILFAASWLQTFNALTKERQIAEFRVSEQKNDAAGSFVELTVIPIQSNNSALSNIFVGNENPNPIKSEPVTYKLYGDTVYFAGPIIEFKDWLKILNLDSIYKFDTVYSLYDQDVELQAKKTEQMTQFYKIGESDERWRQMAIDMQNNNVAGAFYRFFFDAEPQRKSTGVYVRNKVVNGKLFVSQEGFVWKY